MHVLHLRYLKELKLEVFHFLNPNSAFHIPHTVFNLKPYIYPIKYEVHLTGTLHLLPRRQPNQLFLSVSHEAFTSAIFALFLDKQTTVH